MCVRRFAASDGFDNPGSGAETPSSLMVDSRLMATKNVSVSASGSRPGNARIFCRCCGILTKNALPPRLPNWHLPPRQRHFDRENLVKLRHIAILGVLLLGGIVGFTSVTDHMAQAASQAKPVISEEASAALLRMGQSLRAEQFSFQARTIRV